MTVVATCSPAQVPAQQMEKLGGSPGITRLSRSQVSVMAAEPKPPAARCFPRCAGGRRFSAARQDQDHLRAEAVAPEPRSLAAAGSAVAIEGCWLALWIIRCGEEGLHDRCQVCGFGDQVKVVAAMVDRQLASRYQPVHDPRIDHRDDRVVVARQEGHFGFPLRTATRRIRPPAISVPAVVSGGEPLASTRRRSGRPPSSAPPDRSGSVVIDRAADAGSGVGAAISPMPIRPRALFSMTGHPSVSFIGASITASTAAKGSRRKGCSVCASMTNEPAGKYANEAVASAWVGAAVRLR